MKRSRRFIIISAAALAAVGGGAAIAATQQDEAKERENAVLTDAAEQLDVETDELRSALLDARKAQIDQAVEDGKLTQEQADQIKERMDESGLVLGGPGGPGGPHGHHGPPPFFDEVAKELGISETKLHRQLRSGKSLAQIAKANGKTMDELREAIPELPEGIGQRPRFRDGGPPMGGPGGPGGFGGPPPGFRG